MREPLRVGYVLKRFPRFSETFILNELLALNQGRAYFFTNSPDNHTLYMLLRQATEQERGYWLLRLSPDYYRELTLHLDSGTHPLWLLENSRTGEVLQRHAPTATSDDPLQSVMLAFIDNSTWQLRGLFDAKLMQQKLLPVK